MPEVSFDNLLIICVIAALAALITGALPKLRVHAVVLEIVAGIVVGLAFVAFASRFGLESILGAFLAGAVVSLVDRDSSSHPHLRTKLEAIGFGFVVPVFFISSGIKLDLTGLMHSPVR